MRIIKFLKQRNLIRGLEFLKENKQFIAIFGNSSSLNSMDFSHTSRKAYINSLERAVLSDENPYPNYPHLHLKLVGSKFFDVSVLKTGDFCEMSSAYNKAREYLYVIENSDIALLVAAFPTQKKLEQFAKKAREEAVNAQNIMDFDSPEQLSPKERVIRATFERLGATPLDYTSRMEEVTPGPLHECQLCNTQIKYNFPIYHASDASKNLIVGSECVKKQAIASRNITEIEKAIILEKWIAKAKSKANLKSEDNLEVISAPTNSELDAMSESRAKCDETLKAFYAWYETFKDWKKAKSDKESLADIELPEVEAPEEFIHQIRNRGKVKDFAFKFFEWADRKKLNVEKKASESKIEEIGPFFKSIFGDRDVDSAKGLAKTFEETVRARAN